jgi:tetratricopeptide (TPR) repeat protein
VFQEAVRLLRPLTASDPQAALPDLVMSLGNLCEQLTALGRNAEAEELFTQLLAGYSVDSRARGIILLGRGHWSAWDGNITATITDARDALDLLPADAPARAKARRLLRGLRRQDPGRFDLAWDDSRGDQPTWLRHLDVDRLLTDQIDRLVAASTMEEEEALLAANPRLVSEEAEAVLDRLIDDNPGHRWLLMHRDILRVARAGGVEDAYARHRKLLWREGTAKALGTWFSAAREGLRDVMTAERVLLLSDEAVSQVDSMLATTARTPELIWRAGLLALCRSDGEEAAFQISANPGALRRPPGSRALNAFEPRDLALARLRAGFDPDDPEAIFVHAVLALAAGLADEADEAIGRCAEESTSWDRRAAAVHLTDLTAIHPDLAAGLARLRSILAASESGKHSR